jgi:2-dehydro-3-deoxy-D-arabinonate dehydratase
LTSKIVRLAHPSGKRSLGVWKDGRLYDLNRPDGHSIPLATILRVKAPFFQNLPSILGRSPPSLKRVNSVEKIPGLLSPLSPREIWGFGVTYLRSREARRDESGGKGIYDMVYDADRPEIFFKATGSRCVGPNEAIAIRNDSNLTLPEPELAVVADSAGRILGFTCGNDVTARDLEMENPLYLTQAKVYHGSCAIGPAIIPASELRSYNSLKITCRIIRKTQIIFEGSVNTSQLKRSIESMLSYLVRSNPIRGLTVALTGTGVIVPSEAALKSGDTVEVEIEKIGKLVNTVRRLPS